VNTTPVVSAPSFIIPAKEALHMNLANIAIEPIFSILIGILILVVPRFLNYFVAVYLIVIGILGLTHAVRM
jgi:hypothetical protein